MPRFDITPRSSAGRSLDHLSPPAGTAQPVAVNTASAAEAAPDAVHAGRSRQHAGSTPHPAARVLESAFMTRPSISREERSELVMRGVMPFLSSAEKAVFANVNRYSSHVVRNAQGEHYYGVPADSCPQGYLSMEHWIREKPLDYLRALPPWQRGCAGARRLMRELGIEESSLRPTLAIAHAKGEHATVCVSATPVDGQASSSARFPHFARPFVQDRAVAWMTGKVRAPFPPPASLATLLNKGPGLNYVCMAGAIMIMHFNGGEIAPRSGSPFYPDGDRFLPPDFGLVRQLVSTGNSDFVALGERGTLVTWPADRPDRVQVLPSPPGDRVAGILQTSPVVGRGAVLVRMESGASLLWRVSLGGKTANCRGYVLDVPSNAKVVEAALFHSLVLLSDGTLGTWHVEDAAARVGKAVKMPVQILRGAKIDGVSFHSLFEGGYGSGWDKDCSPVWVAIGNDTRRGELVLRHGNCRPDSADDLLPAPKIPASEIQGVYPGWQGVVLHLERDRFLKLHASGDASYEPRKMSWVKTLSAAPPLSIRKKLLTASHELAGAFQPLHPGDMKDYLATALLKVPFLCPKFISARVEQACVEAGLTAQRLTTGTFRGRPRQEIICKSDRPIPMLEKEGYEIQPDPGDEEKAGDGWFYQIPVSQLRPASAEDARPRSALRSLFGRR